MKALFNLNELKESMPIWAQIAIAAFLVSYSAWSVYCRINVEYGARTFSRVAPGKVRTDIGHMIKYTIIPVIVTVWFLWALYSIHFK